MREIDYSHVELESGRKLYAYGPWFSLSAFGKFASRPSLEAGHGWDGELRDEVAGEPLTTAERQEIATHMIARWNEWAARPTHPEGEQD